MIPEKDIQHITGLHVMDQELDDIKVENLRKQNVPAKIKEVKEKHKKIGLALANIEKERKEIKMPKNKVSIIKIVVAVISISSVVLGVAFKMGAFETQVNLRLPKAEAYIKSVDSRTQEEHKTLTGRVGTVEKDVAVLKESKDNFKTDLTRIERNVGEVVKEQKAMRADFRMEQRVMKTEIISAIKEANK